MSTSHRICETCVYCSFAGNCDRYDKPLTSIEQPACDAYDIHPLLAENEKLRELVRDAYTYYYAAYYSGVGVEDIDKQNIEEIEQRMRELGVEV